MAASCAGSGNSRTESRLHVLALHDGLVISRPDAKPQIATVLIDGEMIAQVGASVEVPAAARTIDCSGCTILAGFWNCHVHFFERKWAGAAAIPRDELEEQLQIFARFGFTTVFDLSSEYRNTDAIRTRIDSGEVRGPRILTTGEGIVPEGFTFPEIAYRLLGQTNVTLSQVSNPAEARDAAEAIVAADVDGVKLFASTPSGAALSTETMQAATAVAHAGGLPVFVHPNTSDDISRAVEAGVDVVAHTTPRSGRWNDKLLSWMRTANVALIPTLSLWQEFGRHDRISLQRQQIESATAQLRAWRDAGGDVLFGTDLGATEADPSTEYALMQAAGMSFEDILASLTRVPAARFRYEGQLGRIEPGYAAELTVVFGDPSRELQALRSIRYVMRRGEIIFTA